MLFEKIEGNVSVIKPLMDGYKRTIEEEPLTEEQYAALEKAIRDNRIHFFIAKEDEVVAMCSVSATFSTFTCSAGGIFEDFYILPEYRKTGLARRLTEYVFDWCKQNSIMSLWVGSADCDVEMYRKLGFEIPLGNLLAWSAE